MKHGTKTEKNGLMGKALICGFLLAAAWSFFPFAASCETLPERVIRLHVVANSDTAEDQAVKRKVRDAVLEAAAGWYAGAATMEEANTALCLHLDAIRTAAEQALEENGSTQTAAVQMTDLYFPTRDYEDFSLPAGKYRTLRVTLGRGEGKNWWCVVFPSLCLPAAVKGEASEEACFAVFSEGEREVVRNPRKYRVGFKAVEVYEQFRQWLDGRGGV